MELERGVFVARKDLFCKRMSLEDELCEFLYEQLISLLEIIGKEKNSAGDISDNRNIRLGVYLDSSNDGARFFLLDDKGLNLISNFFSYSSYKVFSNFGIRQQKLGTNLLFQLNEGNISTKDFDDKF